MLCFTNVSSKVIVVLQNRKRRKIVGRHSVGGLRPED